MEEVGEGEVSEGEEGSPGPPYDRPFGLQGFGNAGGQTICVLELFSFVSFHLSLFSFPLFWRGGCEGIGDWFASG